MLGTAAGGGDGDHTCTDACGFCHSCAEINPELVRSFIDLGADRVTHRGDGEAVPKDLAKYIDHTLLRSDATFDQVTKLCQEAREFGFASVCINPCYVRHSAGLLRGSSVKVCTVIGFPLGANDTETKALEARRAIREGATEVDMVINVGALKSGRDDIGLPRHSRRGRSGDGRRSNLQGHPGNRAPDTTTKKPAPARRLAARGPIS